MAKYHVNPETGKVGVCRAMYNCKFKLAADQHSDSKEAAQATFEAAYSDSVIPTLTKEPGVKYSRTIDGKLLMEPVESFDLEAYQVEGKRFALDRLNSSERDALNWYTNAGSKDINEALRELEEGAAPESAHYLVKYLDSALSKAVKLTKPRVLYRSIELVPGVMKPMEEYKAGTVLDYGTYLSTSSNPILPSFYSKKKVYMEEFEGTEEDALEQARQGVKTNLVLRIKSKYHCPASGVNTLYSFEGEHLLPRNTKLKIVGVEEGYIKSSFRADTNSRIQPTLSGVTFVDCVIEDEEGLYGEQLLEAPYDSGAPERIFPCRKSESEEVLKTGITPTMNAVSKSIGVTEPEVPLFYSESDVLQNVSLVKELGGVENIAFVKVKGVPSLNNFYETGVRGKISPSRLEL